MRNRSVWERACGLSRTVVEGVWFDEARVRSWCRCGRSPRRGVVAVVVVVVHRVTTMVRVAVDGERWISARRRSFSRLTLREFDAVLMG